MFINKTIQKIVFSVVALCASVGYSNAAVISGTYNANSYQTFNIDVATTSNVDFQYLSGYFDPIFQLFDAAGNHIISHDDSFSSLYPHLTQTLAAGSYTLLVDYFYGGLAALPGSVYSLTDGFNNGTYWTGGSATLGSVTTYLDGTGYAALSGTPFSFSLTNAEISSGDVPEPESLALFSLALAAMMMARRRQASFR